MSGPDEFDWIARLLRPLATAPEALGLKDDAALLASQAGFDLVLTQDALVAGVHFLPADPLDLVARKALRVSLSDLAAKAAEPFGYLMTVAWPNDVNWEGRALFAQGLAQDQREYGVSLLGGDTVSTPGPLTVSITALGWAPSGRMVARSGARSGHTVFVSGPIGDGRLGLASAAAGQNDAVSDHYRLPAPRLDLGDALREFASSAADISDGLIADLGHIAEASGVAVDIDLERVPLSAIGQNWLAAQTDEAAALLELATGGDDYQLVCTAEAQALAGFTPIGGVREGEGVAVRYRGRQITVSRAGWRHGKDG